LGLQGGRREAASLLFARFFRAIRTNPGDDHYKLASSEHLMLFARIDLRETRFRMSKSDEYRRNADECRRMASRTQKPDDVAAWLRLAYSWLKMISGDHGTETASPPGELAEAREPARPRKKTDWPDPDPQDNQSSH
jgi:hypothetical protein